VSVENSKGSTQEPNRITIGILTFGAEDRGAERIGSRFLREGEGGPWPRVRGLNCGPRGSDHHIPRGEGPRALRFKKQGRSGHGKSWKRSRGIACGRYSAPVEKGQRERKRRGWQKRWVKGFGEGGLVLQGLSSQAEKT